jgi:enamine deaminase RidA (YjgF/YER057c/UK114 family)
MQAEAKLLELGFELPPAPKPVAVYVPVMVVGETAYVSGQGPLGPDGSFIIGRDRPRIGSRRLS